MSWWGFGSATITLGEGFVTGPGGEPAPGYKWLCQMWFGSKYVELFRDLDAGSDHVITYGASDPKGQVLLRCIGNGRQATTTKVVFIRYSGGNWSEGGQNHQTQTLTGPNITFKVPDTDEFRPDVSLSTEPVNGMSGNYIKDKSSLKLTVTSSAKEGTSIRSVTSTTTAGETLYGNEATTGTLRTAGTFTVTTTVTDERGLSKSVSNSVTVLDYTEPSISVFTAQRCNSSGTVSETGTYLKISYAYTVKNMTGNTGTLAIEKSDDNGATWSSLKSDSGLSANTSFTTGNILPTTKTVLLRIKVTDKYATSSVTVIVGPSEAMFGIRSADRALTIGRQATSADANKFKTKLPFHTEDKLSIEGDLSLGTLSKQVLINTIYPVGSVVFLVDGKDPNVLFGGTWVGQYMNLELGMAWGQGLVTQNAASVNGTPTVVFQLGNSENDCWKLTGRPDLTSTTRTRTTMWIRTA